MNLHAVHLENEPPEVQNFFRGSSVGTILIIQEGRPLGFFHKTDYDIALGSVEDSEKAFRNIQGALTGIDRDILECIAKGER